MNFLKPSTTDNYSTQFVPGIISGWNTLSMLLDPALVGTLTNVPTGAKRLNAGNWEQFNGTSWAGITVNAAYAATAGSAATAALAGAVTVANYAGAGTYALTWTNLSGMFYTASVTITPSTGALNANAFVGPLTGNASTATLAANANLLGGWAASPTAGIPSRVVVADGSGYIYNTYYNSTDNTQPSGVSAIMVKAGDNYLRSGTAGAVAAFISGQSMNIVGSSSSCTGNAATASSIAYSGVTGRPTVTVATSGTPSGGSPGDFFLVY
jgi:hypothetical protein